MSDLHSISLQSWPELYQALRTKAEASRGTVTLTDNGAPSATFPHTTTRDVYAIALVFDAAIEAHATRAIVARWFTESNLLGGESEDSTEPYIGNRSFWGTLAAVADELDRVHAPLPALSLIDNAVRTLDSVVPRETSQIRNTSNAQLDPKLVMVFVEPSWKAMALRQFEFFRGLRGEVPGANPLVPMVPTTCNADVLALADYWSDQLARVGDRAVDTYHRLLYSCWHEALQCVRRDARHATPHELYARNSEFWTALLLLATQSDICEAPPTPWVCHLPDVGHHHRNVGPVEMGSSIDVSAAKTWEEAAQITRDAFSRLRGEDVIPGGIVAHIPRTTVEDVRQVAKFWGNAMAKLGERHRDVVGYKTAANRWNTISTAVARIPADANPQDVYAQNRDFWIWVMGLAIDLDVLREAPSTWTLIRQSIGHGVTTLPQTLAEVHQVVAGVLGDVVEGGQRAIGGILAKPALYLGAGIAGIALVALLLRNRQSHPESKP